MRMADAKQAGRLVTELEHLQKWREIIKASRTYKEVRAETLYLWNTEPDDSGHGHGEFKVSREIMLEMLDHGIEGIEASLRRYGVELPKKRAS